MLRNSTANNFKKGKYTSSGGHRVSKPHQNENDFPKKEERKKPASHQLSPPESIAIGRVSPASTVRKEAYSLLQRGSLVSCRAARSAIHTGSPLEKTQSGATLASVSSVTFLSGRAATLFCGSIHCLGLLVQTATNGADGAALEEGEGAPASAPKSRFGLLPVFNNGRLVGSSSAVDGLFTISVDFIRVR